jgi:branched-chain amino acid transport system permease protein
MKMGKQLRFNISEFFEIILFVIIFAIIPLFVPTYYAAQMMMYGLFAFAFNLLYGYAGLLSLGHMLFFGTGAYAVAITSVTIYPNPLLAILMGLLWSAGLGAVIGGLAVRGGRRGGYFALIPLAFNVFFYHLFMGPLAPYTGSDLGLSLPPMGSFWFIDFGNKRIVHYTFLVIISCVLIGIKILMKSKFGALLIATSESEEKVRSLGYDPFIIKFLVFVVSATLSGFAGSLFTIFNGYIGPDAISPAFNLPLLFMVLVGGRGTFFGPFIGSCIYLGLLLYLSGYTYLWEGILGALTLIIVLRFRGGLYRYIYKLIKGGYIDKPIR